MLTPRLSASSYSNTAPLIWSFLYGSQRAKYEMILDNAPSRSAQLLTEKRVDVALVPIIVYQMVADLRLVPQVCVGSNETVKSVCLVTKDKDLSEVKSVSLDISSKTSVALTKIIFREFLENEPTWKDSQPKIDEMLEKADAALLIGDPALTVDEKKFRKFDLAQIWKKFTGFGFVFAMWMTHQEKSAIARQIDFAQARNEGLLHLNEIISNYESEISLSREEFQNYLTNNISFSLDDSLLNGLNLYFKLAAKHSLITQIKPLNFI